jgi:hypothetical protein
MAHHLLATTHTEIAAEHLRESVQDPDEARMVSKESMKPMLHLTRADAHRAVYDSGNRVRERAARLKSGDSKSNSNWPGVRF